ncbi:GAF domain-containing protein [Pedobacter sp. ASV28]|uniref:GAF domain-containing protein n=1 Tax=Pedobacter sp. ASV28 TaxID=2795123 RepID=UPI0018EC4D22|nr:GAF domain-containing protein [Pedobacter sp. ASV28]
MNTNIIKINKDERINCQIEWSLSFRPLVAYLKRRLKTEQTIKKEFYRFLLEKIEHENALVKNLTVEDLIKHKDTLELIFTILTPLMANEKELYWALSTPVPDQIFFSTDLLYDFIQKNVEQDNLDEVHKVDKEKKQAMFIYNMILERFYNYTPLANSEILYGYKNPQTGLTQYYNINVDTQFVDIVYNKKDLPELNFEQFSANPQDEKEIAILKTLLPLNDFRFDGFTVISLKDVTLQHAIDGIRDALVNHTYQDEAYGHIIQALKTLAENGQIEFGLLPLLTVNNKPVFDDEDENSSSILMNSAKAAGLDEQTLYAQLEAYKNDPRPLFFNKITDEVIERIPFLDIIKKSGIESYSLLPVFYNNQLVGMLEIYSKTELLVDEKLLSRLHVAMPFLGQLFKYRIEEFNAKMDEVLKDKFTALQPSVQWKFNQQVWEFIKKNKGKKKALNIETVTFKNLYPIFGAIDIRNSTIERNLALKDDLKVQLNKLSMTLTTLRKVIKLELIDKILFNCRNWIEKTNGFISSSEEDLLNEFLEFEVYPMLKYVEKNHPNTKDIVSDYFESIDPYTGVAYENRRTLETSMQFINTAVGEYLENTQEDLQKTYPCYFAKFRSDGIEYDIYIGQEIAPDIPFDLLYLKNIRLWQLQTMVDIARLTNGLIDKMQKPLLTTQLIFIHSNPIDISFRNDERRFDVEGAYNIRYEVVKKRIDKVQIKNTNERLTQPGKIALVYYNAFEANEYLEYIKYLQEQELLLRDLEMLDLEELQGVSGLKALRVGVNYNVIINAEDISLGEKGKVARTKG